jgi:COMPASS component SWD1
MMHLEDVPEEYDGVLDCASLAICCSFNRRGSLLAVGCNDGRVVIWDFLTRGIAKYINAHANHPICSISWSRNGHRLITASLDNTVAIWHVLSAQCIMKWRFPSPVLKAQFNPRNDKFVLVCLLKHAPLLVEVDYDNLFIEHKILPIDKEDNDVNIVAAFDRRGQHVYTGNTKGRLAIIKCPKTFEVKEASQGDPQNDDLQIVSSFRIQPTGSNPAAIKEIEFSARDKRYFLVNSSDKTIRLFDCSSALKAGVGGTCDEVRKLQDLVNKTMWRRCCFSGNASNVCGGSARQHALYIWDTETGVIKKVLIGTKGELLLDIQWHPMRPVLASISSGLISIWTRPQIENWSAFAPDFRELEENVEYDERESEFDDEDEDNRPAKEQEADLDLNDNVDVIHVEPDTGLLSSDEEEFDLNALEVIPITLEDHEMIDSVDMVNPIQSAPPKEEPKPKKEIEIMLENPPVDEPHPLTLVSTKRIRVSDKMGTARKIPRL